MAAQVNMHMSAQGVEIDVAHPEIGAASIAMSFQGGRPKFLLLFQWCAVLMAFASVVAALPVAALSFGSYGTAKLLGKVSPLRARMNFSPRHTTGSSIGLANSFYAIPETLRHYGLWSLLLLPSCPFSRSNWF